MRIPLMLLALCCSALVRAEEIATHPQDTNALVGQQVSLVTQSDLVDEATTCQWFRNGVLYTGGTQTRDNGTWTLTFFAVQADDGAQFRCEITGPSKGGTLLTLVSDSATITIVPPSTPLTITTPAPNATVTGDTALNPIGVRFTASRPVTTWEVNYPGIDSVFRTFGDNTPFSTNQILVPRLPTANTAVKIRITSPANEVYVGDFTLGAQQLAPVSLSTAVFSSPFYVAFAGVPFSVDEQHGLTRFVRDPNGEAVTYTKGSGSNLTINTDGSFTWTPPAFPAGTSFPGANVQHQLVLAGTFTATDGLHAAVGPFDIFVTVLANPGDLNRDGVVNIQDVQLVLSRYGQNPGVPVDPHPVSP